MWWLTPRSCTSQCPSVLSCTVLPESLCIVLYISESLCVVLYTLSHSALSYTPGVTPHCALHPESLCAVLCTLSHSALSCAPGVIHLWVPRTVQEIAMKYTISRKGEKYPYYFHRVRLRCKLSIVESNSAVSFLVIHLTQQYSAYAESDTALYRTWQSFFLFNSVKETVSAC